MVASTQNPNHASEGTDSSAHLGSWIVEGMLPFFKVVLLLNVFSFIVAAATGTSLTIVHVLVVPSVAGVLYAVYDVHRRIKQRSLLYGYESAATTGGLIIVALSVQILPLIA